MLDPSDNRSTSGGHAKADGGSPVQTNGDSNEQGKSALQPGIRSSEAENAKTDLTVEEGALEILRLADAQAQAIVIAAVAANEGAIPGPFDLDTTGVRHAREMAWKIQQAGDATATERLYNAYADLNMNRAQNADGFIATLDIVFQRVVGILHSRTDRDTASALRKKWSEIARERSAEGWFVSRTLKIKLGPPIQDPGFWNDLETRFRELAKASGDTLTANWISSAWGEDGEQWYLGGSHRQEREAFERLAERGAVGLGHPAGQGALYFWLDHLKNRGFNFNAGYQGMDSDGNVSHGGKIRRPSGASADYCFQLATHGLATEIGEPANAQSPKLNTELINRWMAAEGYENNDLAQALKVTPRCISSLRNGGEHHGRKAVTKLANLMNRGIEDLYLP